MGLDTSKHGGATASTLPLPLPLTLTLSLVQALVREL